MLGKNTKNTEDEKEYCRKIKNAKWTYICFIRGTVKLDTDGIAEKSVVFRITESWLHYSYARKLNGRFLIKQKSQTSC